MPFATLPPAARPLDADMNVTPMIDVLLVLLIIYMLLAQDRFAMPATLPPLGAPNRSSDEQQIVLTLAADGGFTLNGEPIPAPALASTLAAIYAARPAKLLFIEASPERDYQDVVAAMDLARGAGVQVLALMPAPLAK